MQYQSTAFHLEQGQLLGDYEIISVAGSGGMGVVYQARQRSLGRVVALKVIREEIARMPEYRERFLREARLAASIDHPHIVSVYDVGDQDGRLFLALQWIDGQDLKRTLERTGRLASGRAVTIASQLAGALDALHSVAGLIHRDIKPANVVIRQMGGHDHAYLTDFGVAKPAESTDQLTQTGWVVGTVGYVSPEQIRGEQPGPRSDLYALGCLFFEALTGRPPFQAENEMALRWAHANDPRPVASGVVPDLGPRYDQFFSTALALDPNQRFGSGREFASALAAAHDGATATEETTTRIATPHAATAVGPATPIPATPIVSSQTPTPMYQAYGYVTPPPVAPQQARSGSPLALIVLGLVALAGIAVGALAAAGTFSHGTTAARTITAAVSRPSATTATSASAKHHRPKPAPGAGGRAPTGGTTSCGGDLTVGPNTSCGFAQNVEQAYDQSAGGNTQVTAYSPATGLNYTINCTGGSPHVCSGGSTHDASIYFTSGPSGSPSSPAAAAPSTSGAGMHACDQNISGNAVTSCPFAENVFQAYAANYQANGEQSANTVTAYSPVTSKSYNMNCTTDGTTVGCTGAKGALVTFPITAVQNY